MHRHQKTKKHDEIRNTKEDNDWVKTVKEKKDDRCVIFTADQHRNSPHLFRLKIAFHLNLTRTTELHFVIGVIKHIILFII